MLSKLAYALGIATKFSDAGLVNKEYDVNEDIIKFFVNKFGYKADSEADIKKSLEDFANRRWQRTLESIYIVNSPDLKFDVVIPKTNENDVFNVKLKNQATGQIIIPPFTTDNTGETQEKYIKLTVSINQILEIGYYDLTFSFDSRSSKSVLAVAPSKCYELDALKDNKLWGFAIQLYSLKSSRNWGVGDFTDLNEIVKLCAKSGADIIGLNPLNVLTHNYPEEASPYQSISRLFLNPIYIDVEAVPEFQEIFEKDLKPKIEDVRNTEFISYSLVYNLKMEVLKQLYDKFKTKSDGRRQLAFKNFCQEKGAELDKLTIFQSIYDEKTKISWGGWRAWEEEFKHPDSLAVKNYAKSNEDKINFFKYLQFEAHRQFELSYQEVKTSGLKIGFYRDLAVGVGQDSAELWSEPDLFIKEAGAGAPPDYFFPSGQRWGLGAFNPFVLKEKAYVPFIKILRANMACSGALRIDHVMSLMRLYVIPDNFELGTYIYYNFEEMLNIVALESCLNKCTIVGESIGNVPAGFLPKIETKNIHSLSVLWSERWDMGWGLFKSPEDYPHNSFVSVGTHDMAPLKCWWFGYDIKEMRKLNIIETDAAMNDAYHKREIDRAKLLESLDNNNVWPKDNPRQGNYIYGENYPEGIEEAVNKFVARSNCKVFLAELENILGVDKMQNLPGTDRDKHPNWRAKLPINTEDLEKNESYIRCIKAIKEER